MGALAMARKLYLLSSLVFFSLLLDLSKGRSDTEIEKHHHVFEISSLLPKPVCSTSKDDRKSTLTVVHRHGPCSPLGSSKVTATEMLEQDQARVDSLQSRLVGRSRSQTQVSLDQVTLPTGSGVHLNTGNYIVTIGIGTPHRDMSVILDTASDLTWIQCQPCVGSCYSQHEKVFDPAESSTYLNVSCNSVECYEITSATGNPSRCSSSTCVYAIEYGDQSFSIGFFANEKLTLSPSDVFHNFHFGCGQNNHGLFGRTAGLLGLGRNRLSLVSQTYPKYKGVFSYCLPPSSSSTGYLTFGGYKPSPALKFTHMLRESRNPSFYFLNLIGILVGGRRLPISSSVFSRAGTLIDTGTVITRLPPSAYATLRSAFQVAMAKYEYPSAPAMSILDTCFDLSGSSRVVVPSISLLFQGGATIHVDFSGILVATSESHFCLAFAGNSASDDVAIIGNKQQQTLEVVYDLVNSQIGFHEGGCR